MKSISIMGKDFPIQEGGQVGVWDAHKFIMFGGKKVYTEYSSLTGETRFTDNSFIWERIAGWLPGSTIEDIEAAFAADGDRLPVNFICDRFNLPLKEAQGWLTPDRVKKIWLEGASAFTPQIETLRAQTATLLHNAYFAYVFYGDTALVLSDGNSRSFKVGEWAMLAGKMFRLDESGNFETIS
jgi:hypothetical protein